MRVFLTTALAGAGAASCGGQTTYQDEVQASEVDIEGNCWGDSGDVLMCGSSTSSCQCGPPGTCVMGSCQAKKQCTGSTYLDRAGDCVDDPCPSGQVLDDKGSCESTHTCYGAPPLLG
jgi:hypothetical protein